MDFLTGDPAQLPAAIAAFAKGQMGDPGFYGRQPQPEFTGDPGFSQPSNFTGDPGFHQQMAQPDMAAPTPPIMQVPKPELDSISRAMETITNAYARVKSGAPTDRVTAILKARSSERPDWGDIGQAFSQSMGSISTLGNRQYVTVGEALNNIRANKILEAEKIAKVQIDDEELEHKRQKTLVDDLVGIMKHADTMRRQDRAYDLSVEQYRELQRHRISQERIAAANAAGNLDRIKLDEMRAAEQIRHNRVMEGLALNQRTSFQKDYEYLTNVLRVPHEDTLNILKPEKKDRVLSVGESYNTLLELKSYLDAKQDPPQELVNRATAAAHILKTKRFIQTPEGTQSYVPGIPSGFPDPSAQPTPPSSAGAKPTLTMEVPKVTQDRVTTAIKKVEEIADILNEARTAKENITGIEGWVKKEFGGYARQAGVPISPLASRLARNIELLKALAAPGILQESRLSNEERSRLDRIIGEVHPAMDELELRQALADVADLLDRAVK